MKQLQVTRGLLFISLSVRSVHKMDYFIRVQASIASAIAVFSTLPSSLHLFLCFSIGSLPQAFSLCSQHRDLKQHG